MEIKSRKRIWEIAHNYHTVHSIMLVLTPLIASSTALIVASSGLFTTGILFFSGALYYKSVTGHRIEEKIPVDLKMSLAPLGGSSLILGWLMAGISVLKKRF
eukprot:TRINITY_DN1726_c0_g1_i2.p1 TRINITY_DN1726_c0_g1~~TRINITY_DN1726_c0_g1_i2.p1  ORF type:complete len:102 (-),score=13.60 TRINITY_DN1726_c0_g1_i2:193-498(-)